MSDTVLTMKWGKRIPLIILNGFLGAGKTTLSRGYAIFAIIRKFVCMHSCRWWMP